MRLRPPAAVRCEVAAPCVHVLRWLKACTRDERKMPDPPVDAEGRVPMRQRQCVTAANGRIR